MITTGDEWQRCPRGHRLGQGVARCAACWLQAGLETREHPKTIGRYAIVAPLGRGAHGSVFHARQPDAIEVALKVMEKGPAEREIANLMRLTHPSIVRIVGSGLNESPAHFAMQLMRGGPLSRRLKDAQWRQWYRQPQHALEVMIPIAEAVQYAHERLILHCDLKPANILLDDAGRPHVSDFSVAKDLDEEGSALGPSAAGTYPYMSAEQVGAVDKPITTTSDVYGLGAILYELLTGRAPRQARTPDELRASFAQAPSPAPMGLGSAWKDLEDVCIRALRKNPDERYTSAALFAEDLKRVSRGQWPLDRNPTLLERSLRSARRNPWVATSTVLGAVLLAMINVLAFDGVRSQQRELQQLVLDSNAALAKAQAQAALAELRKLRSHVLSTAHLETDRFKALLEAPATGRGQPQVGVSVPGFDNVFVLDCDGRGHGYSAAPNSPARDKEPPADYDRITYTFRDYFRGAMALAARGARDVYIGRAYRSTRDARFYFALSTPVYATSSTLEPCVPGSNAIGVFVASRSASSTLGDVQIPELAGSGQHTALFGPRDRDEMGTAVPADAGFHAIVHRNLGHGDERPIGADFARRLSEHFGPAAPPGRQFEAAVAEPIREHEYVDTIDTVEAPGTLGLGGFYPVGKTGYVVAVSTTYRKATQPVRSSWTLLGLNLAFFAYCLFALWLALSRPSVARRRLQGGHRHASRSKPTPGLATNQHGGAPRP